MQTRLILLFVICFNTLNHSFQLPSDHSEKINAYTTPSTLNDKNYENELGKKLFNIKSNTNSTIWIGNMIAMHMDGFAPFSSDNPKCTEDGKLYKEHLVNQDLWAVQMYDSSAKYPGGLLSGIAYEMGYYDQCLRAHSEDLNIYSAYVLPNVQFQIPAANDYTSVVRHNERSAWRNLKNDDNYSSHSKKIVNINWALCIPDSCSAKDVQASMEELLKPIFQQSHITIKVSVHPALYTSKRTSDAKPTDGYLIFFYMVVILILTLNIVGSLYETNIIGDQHFHCSILKNILLAFSIRTSMARVFKTQNKNESASTDALKLIFAIFIPITHRIYLGRYVATTTPYYMENIMSNVWTTWLNSPVCVEVFFVISGFMMYMSVINRLNKERELKFFNLLFYRLTRLLPAYVIVYLLYMCVLPHIADGPVWKLYTISDTEFCRRNLWKKCLFIDTYIDGVEEICMGFSWYVICEIHFYAIGIILTYAIWKWKKLGIWILGILFAASIYMPARTIYANHLSTVVSANTKNFRSQPFILFVYMKSHQRITTYLIGIAAALILRKLKENGFKISVQSKTFGSIISIIMFELSLYSPTYFFSPGIKYNPWHHVLYFTLQRIVVAICVSYFMVANGLSSSDLNLKGSISKFKNRNFFSVMGKLTYGLFLCHNFFITQSLFSNKTLVEFDLWILIRSSISDVVLGLFCSLLIVLFVETPCITIRHNLDNYFQGVKKQNISTSQENDNKMKNQ
ncbi:nose resistant to fluoxetine protein 6-like isoform X4 [Adelges cooleyi]|uniref:nose resistant to fluoxetine protein 6-like isoform X4 n=1 Tax=Adelges cooleyi TaxID=133065 RepID=UPI00217F4D39|nr:nose resistant to fluoxetine protein 6-like isoform X4 [Adelges cooleyi]